jgi:tetratricopeptide (TPR) repeat protein
MSRGFLGRGRGERPEPGSVVRESTIGRGNVQVSGNVDGPIVAGDVYLTATPAAFHDRFAATRTALEDYHAEVLDREDELRHLLDRLRTPGRYHVIEAPAFAGKTAFMVELYRRLGDLGWPTAVFYVVDRYSNRSGNFLEAVINQLIAVLRAGETLGSTEDRAAQFARLWDDFTALGSPEHPAVLLVDGLDEQLLSDEISPLLPVHLAEHAHVVVTTRSLPDPRTSVPRHHPLVAALSPTVPLTTSPHATARTDDARRHLEAWLASADPAGEDVAALLLVARAPLSRHDLADLLGLSVGEVARHLRAVERCLLPLAVGYQWAHAKYSEFVADWLGAGRRVRAVRQVLEWTTRYAASGWPATTPSFLLHGLHHFLAAHGDAVDRSFLVDLVSTARRQRLLTTFGHDRVFLDTIAVARDLPASADDLELLFRLDLHHHVATISSSYLPFGLLRLLVLSGAANQAEGLASAMDERYRAEAMAEVTEALAETGLLDRARTLADKALAYVSAHDDEYWQVEAQLACMRAARKAGVTFPPPELGNRMRTSDQREAWATAALLLETGQLDDARGMLDILTEWERDDGWLHTWILADVAAMLCRLGDLDAAATMARRAVAFGRRYFADSTAIEQVIRSLVHASRADEATEIAESIDIAGDDLRWAVCGALVEALAETGHHERADEIFRREWDNAATLSNNDIRLASHAHLLVAQAKSGAVDPAALDLLLDGVDEVEHLPDGPAAVTRLGEALLAAGRPEDAMRLAQHVLTWSRRISSSFGDGVLHELVLALAAAGDLPGARELAEVVSDGARRHLSTRAVEMAEVAAGKLDVDHSTWPVMDRARLAVAMSTVDGAEQEALRIATDLVEQWRTTDTEWVLPAVDVVRRLSGVENCESLLSRLKPAALRAEALAELSRGCRAEDNAAADRILREAVGIACGIRHRGSRVSALCAVLTAAGRHARQFAHHVHENAADIDEEEQSLEVALAAVGEYDMALDDRKWLGCGTLAHIADVCVRNGDMVVAGQVAQLAFEMADMLNYRDGFTETLVGVVVRAGRVDLVRPLLDSYDGFDGEPLVHSAVRALAAAGHENEALAMCRDFGRRTWPGAALVAWGSASRWPPEVLRRNLQLLKEVATRA